jgi:hypothetical protein
MRRNITLTQMTSTSAKLSGWHESFIIAKPNYCQDNTLKRLDELI